MDRKVDKVLSKYTIGHLFSFDKFFNRLSTDSSQIIEIIGDSGSGKFNIFQKILSNLKEKRIEHDVYIPSIFKKNQLQEIIKVLTGISKEKFNEFIDYSPDFNFSNKYDFYYYITENLNAQKLLTSKTIIIYENYYLDKYTQDFLQYLAHYSKDQNIKFIIFTRKDTFSFSEKIPIRLPDKKDIQQILQEIFPERTKNYSTEAKLINNISHGNLFIIEYILNDFFKKGEKFDFSSYLDKKINIESIYFHQLSTISEQGKNLLISIFLFDTKADDKMLSNIIDKNYPKHLAELEKWDLIFKVKKKYFVKKVSVVQSFFSNFSKVKQEKYLNPIMINLDEETKNYYCYVFQKCDLKKYEKLINYLLKLNDYETLRQIYLQLLKDQNDGPKKITILKDFGIINKKLNNTEESTENFRNALKLTLENSLPAEEIVFHLAENLVATNSNAFALEIIKKYSPGTIDDYWKWKLVLLKCMILIDMEEFGKALTTADEAYQITVLIDDRKKRLKMQGDSKKQKGLIYYHSNEWQKSETEFTEAEKLYKNAEDIEGLAAIYNNLAGLALQQGEWKNAEVLYNKSLNFEKEKYNLNGICVCYNNLGYLYEDKGDYKKSLYYLQQALEIKKLLGDRNNIAEILHNIGVTYMDNAKYKEAAESFNDALEISIKFKIYRNVIAALNALGVLFFKSGDWVKAIDYYERAIKKSKENNFLEGLCHSYNNLGELYEKRGEYNIAYEFYEHGLELLPELSDDFTKAELYGNLGSVLTCLHKFKEAYKYIVESYDFFKGLNVKKEIIEGSLKQAFYFLQTRNFESANYYLGAALKIAEEMDDDYQIGKCYYLQSFLEKNEPEKALKILKSAIEKFAKTKNNFELALANYEYAFLLFEKEEWEQSLQILNENKKIVKKYGAIKFLEKNDILIQKINKKYAVELKESKHQETLLSNFYEITQNLNEITDFDILIETALDKLVDFAEADGGIFCLYHNQLVKDYWEYMILNNFSNEDKDFDNMVKIVMETFNKNEYQNFKQPHFAPEYNNIISFPLSIRNEKKGVICLFTKHDTYYFTEKKINLLSALCNQIIVIVENITYSSLQKSHEVIREELASKTSFSNIIGKSDKIQNIFRIIEKIKDTPTTILLEGPSGTGKELIARAIHYNSNRRNKKFVAQYCGALPETLLESELFGHVKGSFTGATHDKKGLFEIANGGSFFLDEIADISLSTQAKLLRFLQEGEIKRVGSTRTEKVDVRVICATNVSLKEKVDEGDFRLDLFYRLNVIKIDVPSLSERKSDIPLLAIHFLDKYNKKVGKSVNGITDEALKYMMNYEWPGNIRQLENEIERAVTLAENDSFIRPSDLSGEIFHFQEISETINLLENKSLKDAVENLEKQMILNILEETGWNQTQTAKKLGLSRQGLIKKIQRYRLER
ncbi:MAG TPA: tetratricopeptide repeat protein [Candidatus Cloacimonetes bacterium]|nr:tetratricopeptide repeat protein [Candidatus Cloacimonadota bacterium]